MGDYQVMGTWIAGKHKIISRGKNTDIIDIILSCARNRTYMSARVTSLLSLSTEMYFVWAMVDGLEGTMTFAWGAPDVINEDSGAVDEYDIKAAAAWMIHAAHVFYG